jgi:hypothetical protein
MCPCILTVFVGEPGAATPTQTGNSGLQGFTGASDTKKKLPTQLVCVVHPLPAESSMSTWALPTPILSAGYGVAKTVPASVKLV